MALPAVLLSAAALSWSVDPSTEAVLFEDHRAPVVTLVIELPAGSWSPWVLRSGAATGFTFQDDDPARELKRRADALGVSIELDVEPRAAVARVTALRADIEPAVALLREVLANRDYDPRELARSRRETKILWRQNDTDVGFQLSRAAVRELFAEGDPRRRAWEEPPPLETDREKLARSRDVLLRLPGRLAGFAGDLTRDDAERWLSGLLPPAGEPPPDLTPRLLPLRPGAARARERNIPIRKLTQVYLAYVRDSLPWGDERRPAFLVADHVLGGHFYSRLVVALRHEGGETYGAGTREDGDVAPGTYRVSTFTRAANASRIEGKLLETVRAFREGGITEEERATAVSALAGARAFARQSPAQLLARYRLERRTGLPPGTLDATVDRAAALTLDEINTFIREFYDPAVFSMLRVVPR